MNGKRYQDEDKCGYEMREAQDEPRFKGVERARLGYKRESEIWANNRWTISRVRACVAGCLGAAARVEECEECEYAAE